MRRKWAYACHWLGEQKPLKDFADDFRAGHVALPVNDKPNTNDDDQASCRPARPRPLPPPAAVPDCRLILCWMEHSGSSGSRQAAARTGCVILVCLAAVSQSHLHVLRLPEAQSRLTITPAELCPCALSRWCTAASARSPSLARLQALRRNQLQGA